MAKNTKPKAVNPKVQFERRLITAIRDSSPVSPDFYVEPINNTGTKVKVKTELKVKNIDAVRQVLTEANGRISIDDAVKKFLEIHPMRSTKPEIAAKTAFLQANSHGCPVKIEKIGKGKETEIFIELV